MDLKADERKEKRNQIQDQNRPDINVGSPEYERLLIDDDDDGWSEGEEKSRRPLRPRNLNDSLEYQRNMEDWHSEKSRARLSRYSSNRRASSESVRQRSIRDAIKAKDSGINEDFFQSCASLKSSKHDSSDEVARSPIKSVTRNFLESHHEPVNRLSDIYVAPAKRDILTTAAPKNEQSYKVYCTLIVLAVLFFAYHNFLK